MVILLLAYTSFLPVPALSDSVIRTVEGKVTKVADGGMWDNMMRDMPK